MCYVVVMYIAVIPNRSSPPAVLLRESFREGGKVRNRTLANLSGLPREQVEALRRVLKGEKLAPVEEIFQIIRSLPHGHVAAVLGTLRRLQRDVVCAMIVARILEPQSKLATARGLNAHTASTSLGACLGLDSCDEDDLYEAMDWLLGRQARLEAALAGQHLPDSTLGLYDITTVHFEGRKCSLAAMGASKNGPKGKLQ